MKSSQNNAFTLIELLVVIGIIGVLLTIVVVGVEIAMNRARRIQCASNLRQISLALHMYAHDQRGYLVWIRGTADGDSYWWQKLHGYLGRQSILDGVESVFQCPANPDAYEPYELDYGLNFDPQFVRGCKPEKLARIPEDTVLVTDSYFRMLPAVSASYAYFEKFYNPGDLIDPQTNSGLAPVHSEGVNLLFKDGSVQWQKLEELEYRNFSATKD